MIDRSNRTLEEIKIELIDEISLRHEKGILEGGNAALLKKLIKNAETIDEAFQIMMMGITFKKTGFNFDKRNEKMSDNIRYLKRNEQYSFHVNREGSVTHKLLIGDNYPALRNLLITHKGKVDVIYIDPPYSKDSMGKYANMTYDNKIDRDTLLSSMYLRLQLARRLLKDDGVIFCSIDERNEAYVKCLFDEVFGEENYVQTYTWESNFRPNNSSKLIRPNAEYVLCYLKRKTKESYFTKYSSATAGLASLTKSSETIKTITFPANTVFTMLNDGVYEKRKAKQDSWELVEDIVVKDGIITTPLVVRGHSYWATQKKIDDEIRNGTQIWIKTEKFIPYYQKETSGAVVSTTILPRDYISDYADAKNELESVLSQYAFTNPKPTSLISFLVNFIDNKEAIVLDFYAGSGTTAQAVMELNRKDGGSRQCILCTNLDHGNNGEYPLGIGYDVTARRLKRVMTGEDYSFTNEPRTGFKWLEKNKPYMDNLDVLCVEEVGNNIVQKGKTPFDVIDEACYDMPKFESLEDKIAWVCSNFEMTCYRAGDEDAEPRTPRFG